MTLKHKTEIHDTRLALSQDDDLISGGNRIAVNPANKLVSLTAATLTLTRDLHDQKTIVVDKADGSTITLPASSGSGARYKVYVKTTITSVGLIIKVANATDVFRGVILGADTDALGATGYTWATVAASDTITLSGTATGGKAGDYILIEDLVSGTFSITGFITQSGGAEATPFSATVS